MKGRKIDIQKIIDGPEPGSILYVKEWERRNEKIISSESIPEEEGEGIRHICILIGGIDTEKTTDLPTMRDLRLMLGSIGWMCIDDLEEILGEEVSEKFVKEFQKKYDNND